MKNFIKNTISIVVVIAILISVFNIVYIKFGFGNFSKAVSAKNITSFARDSKVKISNENSYKIENKDFNNATFYSKINVKKNTPYKITCMVKTENVELLENNSTSGAKISILNREEQSNSLIGNNDWTKLTLMLNSKDYESLDVGFMLGGDTENGNVKGTAWFSNFKIEEGTIDDDNKWNFVCFIFKNTNVSIEEEKYVYEMSKNDIKQISDCMERFKNTCSDFSNGIMDITYKIIEIESPITSLTYDEDRGYYVSGADVSSLIDEYLENEDYDHIFLCARLTNDNTGVPIEDWIGLGGMNYKGIGYSNIRMPTSSKSYEYIYSDKINKFPEEVFIHEFLHTLEKNSEDCGYSIPKLHDNLKYGYEEEPLFSLYKWYKDYMNCSIKSVNGKTGVNPELYKIKPVNNDNFKKSVYLNCFEDPHTTIERFNVIFQKIKNKAQN